MHPRNERQCADIRSSLLSLCPTSHRQLLQQLRVDRDIITARKEIGTFFNLRLPWLVFCQSVSLQLSIFTSSSSARIIIIQLYFVFSSFSSTRSASSSIQSFLYLSPRCLLASICTFIVSFPRCHPPTPHFYLFASRRNLTSPPLHLYSARWTFLIASPLSSCLLSC